VTSLSEAESKRFLGDRGITFPGERVVDSAEAAVSAATDLGLPVAVKLGGAAIAHKSERGLVRLGLASEAQVRQAATELLAAATEADGAVHLLVAPMVRGNRELIAGLHRDAVFGMTVMLGVGGVLAEALDAVSCRLVPIDELDALDMIESLPAQGLLGRLRGEPAVDRPALARILLALSDLAATEPDLLSVDLNPLIVANGVPTPVDALVVRA
jgi:acetyl-CoA synthetase (ADP-forming)